MQSELSLEIMEARTLPAGKVNDDCIGHAGSMAWVIDGATDICDEPLIDAVSDAAWLARTIDDWLGANAEAIPGNLTGCLPPLTRHASREFAENCRRQPAGRFEHPSAAGIIVRLTAGYLDFIALSDCVALLELPDGSIIRCGEQEADAGDGWLARHISQIQKAETAGSSADLRALLMPTQRQARERMNRVPGYGVFSITDIPAEHVISGRQPVVRGARVLLASDGFMRLVDVYGAFTTSLLFQETFERGASNMLGELRRIERDDHDCQRFPRLKASDDASVVIGRVE